MNDYDSENQSLDHNPYRYHRIVSLSVNGISGDDPSLTYRCRWLAVMSEHAALRGCDTGQYCSFT
jgi:hypothetical protein